MLLKLRIEPGKLQNRSSARGDPVPVLLSVHDAVGKEGAIKRMIQQRSLGETRVATRGKPSGHDRTAWHDQQSYPNCRRQRETATTSTARTRLLCSGTRGLSRKRHDRATRDLIVIHTTDSQSAEKLGPDELFKQLGSSPHGLSASEGKARLAQFGANALKEKKTSPLIQFLG